MHIVFVSNFLNHHQIPFCEALRRLCDEFHFISTDPVPNIGYQKRTEADYVIDYSENKNRKQCEQLVSDADAVIFGSCPNHLIALRMRRHKLSFLFSERFFKKGEWRRFIPSTRKKIADRVLKYKNEPLYVLCASAYLPYDLSLLKFPADKCYRWGYFPEVKRYDNIEKLVESKRPASVLWAARLIEWKHPEACVEVAKRLKTDGYKFTLNLIGSGELEEKIARKIKAENLSDCVHMLGAMRPEEVREYMEQSQIFLFTSDRNEGWGAVLNESMNSACAVVTSREIGSVPFLIEDGKNGLIYKSGDTYSAFQKVRYLLDNPEKAAEMGKLAEKTIVETYNPQVAAERIAAFSRIFLENGDVTYYESGPMSKARVLPNNRL